MSFLLAKFAGKIVLQEISGNLGCTAGLWNSGHRRDKGLQAWPGGNSVPRPLGRSGRLWKAQVCGLDFEGWEEGPQEEGPALWQLGSRQGVQRGDWLEWWVSGLWDQASARVRLYLVTSLSRVAWGWDLSEQAMVMTWVITREDTGRRQREKTALLR